MPSENDAALDAHSVGADDDEAHSREVKRLREQNTELRDELERVRRKSKELTDFLTAVNEEALARRRRLERESEAAVKLANEKLVLDLAPALDDLARALSTLEQQLGEGAQSYIDGVRLVEQRLLAVLSRFGVTMFSTLGQPFDPQRAEAFAIRRDDSVRPGVVVEELRQGLLLHDKLIRPALVIVSEGAERIDDVDLVGP